MISFPLKWQIGWRATMSETGSTILDKLREFERSFRKKYGREMNDEELRLLRGVKEMIQQRLRAEASENTAA
jgi:hypothetical protein